MGQEILINFGSQYIISRWKMPENTAGSAKIKCNDFLPAPESASLRVVPDAKNRCT